MFSIVALFRDDVLGRELRIARDFTFLDAIERVGLPRGRDAVDDVGLLAIELVGNHDQALDRRAVDAAAK
jgi:hypothetical protein